MCIYDPMFPSRVTPGFKKLICEPKLKGDSQRYKIYLGAGIFFGRGGQKYTGGHKLLRRKIGGHNISDDQNVGSHKMTTNSVFNLFKKTDFNTILACLGGEV